ncbi:RNA-directed RNA polymerase [Trichinella pseudospiralis]
MYAFVVIGLQSQRNQASSRSPVERPEPASTLFTCLCAASAFCRVCFQYWASRQAGRRQADGRVGASEQTDVWFFFHIHIFLYTSLFDDCRRWILTTAPLESQHRVEIEIPV